MKGAYQVKFPQKIISSLVDAYFELYHMYKLPQEIIGTLIGRPVHCCLV